MIGRYYYKPSETQRAEINAAAAILKQRIETRRREREGLEELERAGFTPEQAREIVRLDSGLKGEVNDGAR